ncbi:MAG TPA: phosphoenolpyruvate synthase regulatory protein, partial [Syntrophomonas sp.]|nr:phosphoenolpyruvate synthase regulatory protein [Syntrophomonas sp.]
PGVYIVSDSIGETAEMVVRAAASQFNSGNMEIRRVPNISDVETLEEIVHQAQKMGFMIAYTLVVDDLADYLKAEAEKAGVVCIDVLGPLIDAFKKVTSIEP